MLQRHPVNMDNGKVPATTVGALLCGYQPDAQIIQCNSHASLSKGIFRVPEAGLTVLTLGSLPLN